MPLSSAERYLYSSSRPPIHPRASVEQKFKRPAIAHAFAQAPVPMRMGIHKARDQKSVRDIDGLGVDRRCYAGQADLNDELRL